IIILHCVTDYPASMETINLRAMLTLKDSFKTIVGYSDHTLGDTAPLGAVSMGAAVIEKHFTLDKDMEGPDHKASLEPSEFKEMINKVRKLEKALGDGIKRPTENENRIKEVVRKSIVARKDIAKDLRITKDMIEIKRPGTGIEPKHLDKLIGKKPNRSIKKEELITWDMIK
ncbi:MAG: N-acetylneuraminate synthase family protein, partial [Thermoplasmatota archaeon]